MKILKKINFQSNYLLLKNKIKNFSEAKLNTKSMNYEEKVEYYENEFNNIYLENKNKVLESIKKELSEEELNNINILFKELISLKKPKEKIAFSIYVKQYNINMYNIDLTKANVNTPEYDDSSIKFWPKDNPNWGKLELNPSNSTEKSSDKKSNSSESGSKKENKAKEIKQIMDIKLVSYEPTKKITLIKEIRAFMNLGLKEAKDLVESAPNVIQSKIPTEEAEAFREKFKDLCVIELI